MLSLLALLVNKTIIINCLVYYQLWICCQKYPKTESNGFYFNQKKMGKSCEHTTQIVQKENTLKCTIMPRSIGYNQGNCFVCGRTALQILSQQRDVTRILLYWHHGSHTVIFLISRIAKGVHGFVLMHVTNMLMSQNGSIQNG